MCTMLKWDKWGVYFKLSHTQSVTHLHLWTWTQSNVFTRTQADIQQTSPCLCFLVRCHYTIKRKPSGNRLSTTSCLLLWWLPHCCSCKRSSSSHNFTWVSFSQTCRVGGRNKEAGVFWSPWYAGGLIHVRTLLSIHPDSWLPFNP